MNTYRITLIPGDGIGPEVTDATTQCLEAVARNYGFAFEWDRQIAGEEGIRLKGDPLPNDVLHSIDENKIALKGPMNTPQGSGYRSINVELRKAFDLYACVRPIVYHEGVRTRILNPEKINFTIIRANTEDLYAGIEFRKGEDSTKQVIQKINERREVGASSIPEDAALSIKYYTKLQIERITKMAFEYAKFYGKKSITATSKDNIQKCTDGMFHEVAATFAASNTAQYPGIKLSHMIVDNTCNQLVQWPEQFEVILAPNLYGDILSDLGAGLVGGLGVAPGANIGDNYAIFEATHGTAPDIAGQQKANPTALILSSGMMLRHIGEHEAAKTLETAVYRVLAERTSVTRDLNRAAGVSTNEMTRAIIENLRLQHSITHDESQP